MSPCSSSAVTFVVPGRAQPGGSKRAFIRGGRAVVTDANKNVGAWKERVSIVAAGAYRNAPLAGPLRLSISVVCIRPASHFTSKGALAKGAREYPSVKPDLTKLVRAIEDALTGIVWVDDAQVVHQCAEKIYGARDEVVVAVRPMSGVPAARATFEEIAS